MEEKNKVRILLWVELVILVFLAGIFIERALNQTNLETTFWDWCVPVLCVIAAGLIIYAQKKSKESQ